MQAAGVALVDVLGLDDLRELGFVLPAHPELSARNLRPRGTVRRGVNLCSWIDRGCSFVPAGGDDSSHRQTARRSMPAGCAPSVRPVVTPKVAPANPAANLMERVRPLGVHPVAAFSEDVHEKHRLLPMNANALRMSWGTMHRKDVRERAHLDSVGEIPKRGGGLGGFALERDRFTRKGEPVDLRPRIEIRGGGESAARLAHSLDARFPREGHHAETGGDATLNDKGEVLAMGAKGEGAVHVHLGSRGLRGSRGHVCTDPNRNFRIDDNEANLPKKAFDLARLGVRGRGAQHTDREGKEAAHAALVFAAPQEFPGDLAKLPLVRLGLALKAHANQPGPGRLRVCFGLSAKRAKNVVDVAFRFRPARANHAIGFAMDELRVEPRQIAARAGLNKTNLGRTQGGAKGGVERDRLVHDVGFFIRMTQRAPGVGAAKFEGFLPREARRQSEIVEEARDVERFRIGRQRLVRRNRHGVTPGALAVAKERPRIRVHRELVCAFRECAIRRGQRLRWERSRSPNPEDLSHAPNSLPHL